MSYQFFRVRPFCMTQRWLNSNFLNPQTEDDGYFYTTDHNYTTPWNFARDVPAATHVIIHIGYVGGVHCRPTCLIIMSRANDSGQNVTSDSFVEVYKEFFVNLRKIYAHQPIFVFTPVSHVLSFFVNPTQKQSIVSVGMVERYQRQLLLPW